MRLRRIAVLTTAGLLGLTGCTAQEAAPQDEASPLQEQGSKSHLSSILESGELKVCTTGDYPPYSHRDPDTGKYSGIDISLVEDLAQRLEVKTTYTQTTWKDFSADFLAGCDIGVGGVTISLTRAEYAFFPQAHVQDGKTPITLCENVNKYDTIEKINQPGVRSISPNGASNQEFAEKFYPDGELILWEDNNTIFDEIIEGRADVMTTDASETKWAQKEHPELCAVHPDKPFNSTEKAFMLPLGDSIFQEYVDQWLTIAKRDGTYEAAIKPWWG
jgi:cyclohexadienyl dehydratase